MMSTKFPGKMAMSEYYYQFQVSGMSCQHCVDKVYEVLAGVAGVEQVEVHLETGRARVQGSDPTLSEHLATAIRGSGYETNPVPVSATTMIPVLGMSCPKCVAKAELAIRSVPGVLEAKVYLETRSARVEGVYRLDEVVESIESAGFSVSNEAGFPASNGAAEEPIRQTRLAIRGMSCMKCVGRVEQALGQLEGVQSVQVELEPGLALVTGDVAESALVAAVQAAGYEVEAETAAEAAKGPHPATDSDTRQAAHPKEDLEQISLAINGMTCASCVASVERALTETPGVIRAAVNFADRSALVTTSAGTESLLRSVRAAGYEASIIEDEDNFEERDRLIKDEFRRSLGRSFGALCLGAGLMTGSMTGILPGLDQQLLWIGLGCLTLLAMYLAGGHFYRGAWKALQSGQTNMDTLIALGTGAAWLYSMLIITIPDLVPATSRFQYFEAAILILGFVNLGSALELRARGKTSQAIRQLLGLQVRDAIVLRDGKEITLPIADIVAGDQLLVKPGQHVPVDGMVQAGASHIDESMLTGEPMPVAKSKGDPVTGGTINQVGSLTIEATRVGRDTSLARIIQLVREAQNSKPAIARLTDRIASIFVPVVLGIAVVSALIWYFVGPEPKVSYILLTTMSILIIACPCALGLATPMSIMVGVGRAAGMGILVRNGEALQRTSQLTTIVFDKTGTLTLGKPAVSYVYGQSMHEDQLLELAAAVEQHSEHPLANAILGAAADRRLAPPAVESFVASPGGGVSGVVNNQMVLIGNRDFLCLHEIDPGLLQAVADQQAEQGATPVFVVVAGVPAGLISISDTLKPDSAAAIGRLKSLHIQTVMLTGDNAVTAHAVAAEIGIDRVLANVKPDQKAEQVRALQAAGEIVGMVGDGINDSPALAVADVGFAMGGGTDIALETADIALMKGSVRGVNEAIAISRLTMANIHQNLIGAFLYNTLCIPIAAGVLFPLFGLLLSPVFAGAAMAMSSVTVVTNANRLRYMQINI